MDYWRATDPIVETAQRVADAAAEVLARHGSVTVSLRGLRGISSSFANVLLQRLVSELGPDRLESLVHFETDNAAQADVVKRSLEAVRQSR